MNRAFKIILIVISAISISFIKNITFIKYRYSSISIYNYVQIKGCEMVGGKSIGIDCTKSKYKCFFPFKDQNKPCKNSQECSGKCVIGRDAALKYCPGKQEGYIGELCSGSIIGRCQIYPGEGDYELENNTAKFNSEFPCPL